MSKLAVKRPDTLVDVQETITIEAVTAAIQSGFNPGGNRQITLKQVVDTCAVIVAFLKVAEKYVPARSLREWRDAVEHLNITLGTNP